ncbi:MAG: hypothetical protein ACTS5Y_09960, partial [Pollutimonas bauzanensis]
PCGWRRASSIASSSLSEPWLEMVAPPHIPVPFSPPLEDLYIPDSARIAAAVRKTLQKEKK